MKTPIRGGPQVVLRTQTGIWSSQILGRCCEQIVPRADQLALVNQRTDRIVCSATLKMMTMASFMVMSGVVWTSPAGLAGEALGGHAGAVMGSFCHGFVDGGLGAGFVDDGLVGGVRRDEGLHGPGCSPPEAVHGDVMDHPPVRPWSGEGCSAIHT